MSHLDVQACETLMHAAKDLTQCQESIGLVCPVQHQAMVTVLVMVTTSVKGAVTMAHLMMTSFRSNLYEVHLRLHF